MIFNIEENKVLAEDIGCVLKGKADLLIADGKLVGACIKYEEKDNFEIGFISIKEKYILIEISPKCIQYFLFFSIYFLLSFLRYVKGSSIPSCSFKILMFSAVGLVRYSISPLVIIFLLEK